MLASAFLPPRELIWPKKSQQIQDQFSPVVAHRGKRGCCCGIKWALVKSAGPSLGVVWAMPVKDGVALPLAWAACERRQDCGVQIAGGAWALLYGTHGYAQTF